MSSKVRGLLEFESRWQEECQKCHSLDVSFSFESQCLSRDSKDTLHCSDCSFTMIYASQRDY